MGVDRLMIANILIGSARVDNQFPNYARALMGARVLSNSLVP